VADLDVLDDIDDGVPADPFPGRDDQDVLAVRLADGRRLEGSLMRMGGMAFIQVKDPYGVGKVEGPFSPADVLGTRVVHTRQEVLEERRERARGEIVPGNLVRTRDGYEARLDRLARAAALETSTRKRQIELQFDDVAEEIELAKTKRKWILDVARWNRFSNEEPTKLDLSGGCMTTAMKYQRPRPQDFDPDPKVRRARVPVPDHVAGDPLSTWNMMRALRSFGYNARASILGEVTWDGAELLVDFPQGREKGRYHVTGRRDGDGVMQWGATWDGNGTKTDERRRFRCQQSDEFGHFKGILAYGILTPGFVEKGRPAHRVDLLVDDAGPVFDWLREYAPEAKLRQLAVSTTLGQHFVAVFEDEVVASTFRECWRDEIASRERLTERRRAMFPSAVP
jgi:hypothetical protein